MSRQINEIRIVENLKAAMLTKLRKNSNKAGWWNEDNDRLFLRALDEMMELRNELRNGSRYQDVLLECADVANIMAMIADNVQGDQKE